MHQAGSQFEALRQIAETIIEIDEVVERQIGPAPVPCFLGRLRLEPEAAYEAVAAPFLAHGCTALLQEAGDRVALLAVPRLADPQPSRLWLSVVLFVLTIGSTMMIGGATASGIDIGLGLQFSAAILSILLAHELGHFFAARRLGVAVSYPFFLPIPLFPLGTMGAFISIKEPPKDRRTLLAIGIAGPLAGLVVAIPVLLLGLRLSEVQTVTFGPGMMTEGNSLLYAALKILAFGRFLPAGSEDVFLHPVALAGWGGLLVTGLNLLPAGQLDGGHILTGLVGPQVAQNITIGVAAALVVMGFLWNGWFIWAILIALFSFQRAPLLNEVAPLRGRWRWLALAGLLLFALTFVPIPITLYS